MNIRLILVAALAAFVALWATPETVRGQIIYGYSNNGGPTQGTVALYDGNSGATLNPSFVTGLNTPRGIALAGNDLYVVNNGSSSIGEYNATTGATINASLVPDTGMSLGGPRGIAVFGGHLFVTNSVGIAEYDATTGATINSSFVSGLTDPRYIAISGGNLWVTTARFGGTIGEYDATTGAAINASLISVQGPQGIVVSGNNLWVANNVNYIGEYNSSTGAPINASLVSGLDFPTGLALSNGDLYVFNHNTSILGKYDATTGAAINPSLASTVSEFLTVGPDIAAVPEPATWAVGFLTAGALLHSIWRRRVRPC
jgi:hypothetical protein